MKKRFVKAISVLIASTMVLSSVSFASADEISAVSGEAVQTAIASEEDNKSATYELSTTGSSEEAKGSSDTDVSESKNDDKNKSENEAASKDGKADIGKSDKEAADKDASDKKADEKDADVKEAAGNKAAGKTDKEAADKDKGKDGSQTSEESAVKASLSDGAKSEESKNEGSSENEPTTAAEETPSGAPDKPSAAISGLKVARGDGSEYGMFPISNAVYTIDGDKVKISFTTAKKKIWTRIYLGLCTDENKESYFEGTVNDRSVDFQIEVPVSDANSWIPVSLWRGDKVASDGTVTEAAHWKTDEYLWMSVPNITSITGQPKDVCVKTGKTAALSVGADGDNLSYKWQYSIDNSSWSDCTGEAASSKEYSFEMSKETEGYYRCVISGTYGEVISNAAKAELASDEEGYFSNSAESAVYSDSAMNKTDKRGTPYTMFKIAESGFKVKGNKIEVSVGVKPASSGKFSYSHISIYTDSVSSKAELTQKVNDGTLEKNAAEGKTDTAKNLQFYTFIVPLSCAGKQVYFVPKSASKGTWSIASELAIAIPALADFKAPGNITVTVQPKDVTAAPGAQVKLSTQAQGDEGSTLSYKWQFSKDGKTWSDADGAADASDYSFKMTQELAGKYRCLISDGTGTEVLTNEVSVNLPTAPVITGSTVRVVKDNGDNFKMFVVESSEVTSDNKELDITVTTKNVSFNKLYFGYKDSAQDAAAEDIIKGTENKDGGYTFHFKRPVSDKGKVLPLSLCKADGTWYTNQYLWMYIPDEGISESEDTDISAIFGGTGAKTSGYFNIVSSKAVLKSDSIVITLNTKNSGERSWNKLYIGNQEEAKGKDASCVGKFDADTGIMSYTFEIPRSKQGMNIAVTPGNDTGWFAHARDIFINIPNFDNVPTTTENGVYDLYGSAAPTNNVIALCFERESQLKIENNKAMVTLVTQAKNYDKLYIGDVSDKDSVKDEKAAAAVDRSDIGDAYRSFTFEIPLSDLGKDIKYVVHNKATGKWNDKQSTFKINSILGKISEITPPSPTEPPTPTVTPAPNVPADGVYSTTGSTGAAMFKVVDVRLTVKNGRMTARLTTGGTGNVRLYMGSAKDAPENSKDWIEPCGKVMLDSGKEGYQFDIPVSALDTQIKLSSQGESGTWRDRTVTISSADLKKLGSDPDDTPSVTPGSTPKPTQTPTDSKPETESQHKADTSGSTSAVNNSTSLKDGVYTPDSFTISGGTGRVKISCSKVTITNGQAFATIVFSSSKYSYVKANGNVYYPSVSGGTSSFTIPVELNKNNKIIGMTTAMTQAHEIEYTIFVYLAAASNTTAGGSNSGLVSSSNKELDEKAPEIVGLTYRSETKIEHAEYFKIFNYDDGIVLLEIDTTKDTARDPDKSGKDTDKKENDKKRDNKKSDKKTDKSNDDEKDILEEESGADSDSSLTTEEDIAALYQENVVKYLIVPEETEIPVGLDKDMIVIQRSDKEEFRAFVSSLDALGFMDDLDELDKVSALGIDKEDIEKADKEIASKLDIKESNDKDSKKDKNAAKDKADREETSDKGAVISGTGTQPDYKAMVKAKVNIAFFGSELLPKEKDEEAVESKTKEAGSESFVEKETDKKADENVKASDKKKKTVTEELTEEEQEERFAEITDKLAVLGIPAVFDRSKDEKSELAKAEWVKVYGAVFGKSEEAENLFDAKVKKAEKNDNGVRDEKTNK